MDSGARASKTKKEIQTGLPASFTKQEKTQNASLQSTACVYAQAHSQKILLSSAFEEKGDLLRMQYSPGAVVIVWCMLIAHIHVGLY